MHVHREDTFFRRAGLNIEDFMIKIPVGMHRLKPRGIHTGKDNWNAVWDAYRIANPNAQRGEILLQLRQMIIDFRLDEYVSILVP